jgi:hypothetical protein
MRLTIDMHPKLRTPTREQAFSDVTLLPTLIIYATEGTTLYSKPLI